MVLLGALERVTVDEGPRFLLKGGTAMELRFALRARATKDVDVVFLGPAAKMLDALDGAFEAPYGEFTFVRGEAEELGPHAHRLDVKLGYQTRAWATVRLEISSDTARYEPEPVRAIGLEDFRLAGPQQINCLPLRYQVAQKIHAVTEQPPDRENERFRDLVDLLLLRGLIEDPGAVARACEETFVRRGTHAWPPELVVPASWREGYRTLAVEIELDVTDVDAAADQVRELIAELARA
jgi:hypothetical protein